MDNFKCDLCSGTEYHIDNGIYFCEECGTQSQKHREIEYVMMNQSTDFRAGYESTRIAKENVALENDPEEVMLTSWEEQNYILLGYTDFLIEMGAPRSIKLLVLQLWTTYLKRSEAAFFDKEKPEPPRIYFVGHQHDIRIITNQRKRRRSSKGSSKGSTMSLNTRRRIRSVLKHETKQFIDADYQSYMAYNQSDLSKSLTSLSFSSNASSHAVLKKTGIALSRRAKKMLKSKFKMNRPAIRSYTQKLANFKHVKTTVIKNVSQGDIFEYSRFKILIVILAVALNLKKSHIQFSDLIRFGREGHFRKVEHFFPENIPRKNLQLLKSIKGHESPTYSKLVVSVNQFCKELYITPEQPNFSTLCEKLVDELYLPQTIMKYINRLLTLCPPKMSSSNGYRIRNYESRAMGYIIFVLKLMFGLNDHTETLMSQSAKSINNLIRQKQLESKELFVWDEWMQYIEMRRIIIAECYNKSNSSYTSSNYSKSRSYTEYLTKKYEDFDASTLPDRLQNLKALFDKMKLNDDAEYLKLPPLEPTLTPFKSYLEVIMEHKRKYDNFPTVITKEMYINHPMRNLSPFLRPKILVDTFAAANLRLNVKLVENVMDNIDFVLQKRTSLDYFGSKSFVTYIEDCDEEEWIAEITDKNQKVNEKNISKDFKLKQKLHEAVLSRDEAVQASKELEKLEKKNQHEEPDEKLTMFTMTSEKLKPRKIIERNILDDIYDAVPRQVFNSTVTTGDDSAKIDFFIHNFDYWVYKMSFIDSRIFRDKFEVFIKLPKNFQFLLDECARILETEATQIYTELNIIENYFLYVLQPINGKQTIEAFGHFYKKSGGLYLDENIRRLRDLY